MSGDADNWVAIRVSTQGIADDSSLLAAQNPMGQALLSCGIILNAASESRWFPADSSFALLVYGRKSITMCIGNGPFVTTAADGLSLQSLIATLLLIIGRPCMAQGIAPMKGHLLRTPR
jgi:hypothetical protein